MGRSWSESNTDKGEWGNGEVNGGGGHREIYGVIEKVDSRVRSIERDGCGLRDVHDREFNVIHKRIDKEREDREKMGDKLEKTMNTIRNQILFGIAVAMFLAILAGKFL